MSFLGGGGHSVEGAGHDPRSAREHVEHRRSARSTRLGAGTLACPRCDAPVATGPEPVGLSHRTRCPFCDHAGPVRDFLFLQLPTRPHRVSIHLRAPW